MKYRYIKIGVLISAATLNVHAEGYFSSIYLGGNVGYVQNDNSSSDHSATYGAKLGSQALPLRSSFLPLEAELGYQYLGQYQDKDVSAFYSGVGPRYDFGLLSFDIKLGAQYWRDGSEDNQTSDFSGHLQPYFSTGLGFRVLGNENLQLGVGYSVFFDTGTQKEDRDNLSMTFSYFL